MTRPTDGRESQFAIGTVSRLTGISTHTLRVWEKRHQAVVAQRASNGRRFYTPEDIERLTLLKNLVDQGNQISSIAGLSLDELRDRVRDLDKLRQTPVPATIRLAVLGDSLPRRLPDSFSENPQLELVAKDTDPQRFRADLQGTSAHVLILELPIVGQETKKLIDELLTIARARRCVLVYGFGRQADIERLAASGVRVVRAPVTPGELEDSVFRSFEGGQPKVSRRKPPRPEAPVSVEGFSEPVIPRRLFSLEQLDKLASASSTIECECPRHLVDLIRGLTAFEMYSQACEDRNPEDAALHAYLHGTTAQARSLIESALERVAAMEGLKIHAR